MTTDEEDLGRLQQRLERERRARRQAEIIAERGMRELWQANNELQERVSTRTADLERTARIVEYRHRARLVLVARIAESALDAEELAGGGARAQLARILRLVPRPDPPAQGSLTRNPVDVADEVVGEWQHVAARSGLLLSVEVDGANQPVQLDWAAALASLNAVLDGCVRDSAPGGLVVTLATTVDGASLRIAGGGPRHEHRADEPGSTSPGPVSFGDDLAMARVIAEWVGGSLAVDESGGAAVVDLTIPAAGSGHD